MSHNSANNKPGFLFDCELTALLDTSNPEPTVVLSGKPGEVLRYLIASPNKVLSITKIQQAVWGSTVVTRGSVKDYIAQIRAALQDSAATPKFIETIRGCGYRYLGGISTSGSLKTPLITTPTLAILPLRFSDNANQRIDMSGEFIAANLIGSASRSTSFKLISLLSARRINDSYTDQKMIGSMLGADYLLSGLYYYLNDKLTLLIKLSHVNGANVVWTEIMTDTTSKWVDRNSNQQHSIISRVAVEIRRHETSFNPSEIERLALRGYDLPLPMALRSTKCIANVESNNKFSFSRSMC